jgi:hypothetical protein
LQEDFFQIKELEKMGPKMKGIGEQLFLIRLIRSVGQ